MKLSRSPLQGRFARLEPLNAGLRVALAAALAGHAEDWALMSSSAAGTAFDPWWDAAVAAMTAGSRITYAVRRLADEAVVGTTSFTDISAAHRRVEIGMTFLGSSARAGPVNPDIKLAMLSHAFAAGAVRVELVTDVRNLRSQAAIAKLGPVAEGVLRRHKITWTGHVRDTVMFAITDLDWPVVRAGLEARLNRFETLAAP